MEEQAIKPGVSDWRAHVLSTPEPIFTATTHVQFIQASPTVTFYNHKGVPETYSTAGLPGINTAVLCNASCESTLQSNPGT